MKRLTIIPKMELDLNCISLKAENNGGIYTVQSQNKACMFCYDKKDFLIVTLSKGYLKDTIDNIEKMCKETLEVIEDIKVLEDEKRLGSFESNYVRKEKRLDKKVAFG